MNSGNRTRFILLLILGNIFIDQITKIAVRLYVTPGRVSEIIGQYFILTNVENSGAFLGMGSDLSPTLRFLFLLLLPVVVLGWVVWHLFKETDMDRLSLIGFCCIVGGGISNVFDRILFGSVTDFLHIDLGGSLQTGIFNVADMSVTTGMILLLWSAFRQRKREQPEQA